MTADIRLHVFMYTPEPVDGKKFHYHELWTNRQPLKSTLKEFMLAESLPGSSYQNVRILDVYIAHTDYRPENPRLFLRQGLEQILMRRRPGFRPQLNGNDPRLGGPYLRYVFDSPVPDNIVEEIQRFLESKQGRNLLR